MKSKLFTAGVSLMALVLVTMTCWSCGPKKIKGLENTIWDMQMHWTSGPVVFNLVVNYKADHTLTFTTDTATTYNGTWSAADEKVVWSIDLPGKNTSYRATYDDKGQDGVFTDDAGGSGNWIAFRR